MSPYQGLNLPQLMELLHDLVRPEPVAWTPQTIGWLVVAGWAAVVVLLVIWNSIQKWRRNRYRREALAELRQIESQQDPDPQAMASAIATLLKRTALAAYARTDVADLYGAEWAKFLCSSAANDRVVERSAEALSNAAYARDANGPELLRPAQRWIKVHRA